MKLSKTELYDLAKEIPAQQIELSNWDYDKDGDSFVTYENDCYEIEFGQYFLEVKMKLSTSYKGSKIISESHVEIDTLWCGDDTKVILSEKQTKTLTKAIIKQLSF